MKNIVRIMLAVLLVISIAIPTKADMRRDKGAKSPGSLKQTTAGCSPSSAYEWLNINNVRTRINAGGDMWWDLPGGTGSKYFIPANGTATSLFAGSLWIAGVDVNNQLKCAAVRFRQDGNDFWTGPLSTDGSASIDAETCARWDKIFNITRAQVDEFLSQFDENGAYAPKDGYTIPTVIEEWPAHPDGNTTGVSHYLAPFYDADGDGEYNPTSGDYPYYDIDNSLCHTKTPTMDEEYEDYIKGSILSDQVLKGDQTLWWVFNDKGNSHTESNGASIGLEIRGQAFAFSTNDEINNMSFCSYEIINRSTYTLTGTYFSPWTDVDLGYAYDDYVGCDVSRGLGYGYNGDDVDGDGQTEAYGSNPPAVGVDFFQGPYMDADNLDNPKYSYQVEITYFVDPVTHDTTSIVYDTTGYTQLCDESINGVNFGNGIVDDERFGMRRFLYHDNGSCGYCDPDDAAETYNILRGIWRDGNPMMYGGNAYSGANVVGPQCDFMFPGDTDPCNWGTGGIAPNGGYNQTGKYWTESQCGNNPNDRRFMQSAGPFTLEPGAVNYITFGVPWARANSGNAWASVEKLRIVDDKCQALFDNCFKVIDGPNAPDLTIRELDQKLIIYLSNSTLSNNYKEGYTELDPEIPVYRPDDSTLSDRYYRFEGYQVYQLANDEVTANDLDDKDKARLVFQCDIHNNVSKLVNFEWDDNLGANVPAMMVEGADGGITHSFVLTDNEFSDGSNTSLVNHTTYYFMAIAYAYNNFMTYAQDGSTHGLEGQTKPYLGGRKNIQVYSATPHKTVNGVVLNSSYSDRPAITRIVGIGNGGNELELTDESVAELFTKKLANEDETVVFGSPDYPVIYHPSYKQGYGPLDVKIIDPLNVVSADYELYFTDTIKHYTHGVTGLTAVVGDSAMRYASHWYLRDLANPAEVYGCDTTTIYADEKMFIDRGISVTINQPYDVGPRWVGKMGKTDSSSHQTIWMDHYEVLAPNNGVISTSVIYQDSTKKWLDGIRDKDLPGTSLNWIRSGSYAEQVSGNSFGPNSDYDVANNKPYDPDGSYEKIANGTWAPYMLTGLTGQASSNDPGPLLTHVSLTPDYFDKIGSIDIVLTSDRSKWTRCPVVEMCMDESLSQNNAKRFYIRKSPSIDKDGNFYTGKWYDDTITPSTDPEAPNYIASQGMGWFPGYVIDVETGARLNLVYGEDSYLANLNGRDMQFNPPALLKATVDEAYGDYSQMMDPSIYSQPSAEPVFGGKHFVYIFGMDHGSVPNGSPFTDFNSPAYDGGKYAFKVMNFVQHASASIARVVNPLLWRQCMWVGMPMAVEGQTWLQPGNDVRIRIRVSKPYACGYGYVGLDSLYSDLNVNGLYPKYTFSINGLNPVANDPEKTKTDLDLITIVPNPYYAYSEYESNALTNRVKITNLPKNCVVSIFTISGTKVRQFKKDNDDPSIEWDLTNFASTPVASGFYLIHVKDNTSGGERVVKFFAAMRKVDLNSF